MIKSRVRPVRTARIRLRLSGSNEFEAEVKLDQVPRRDSGGDGGSLRIVLLWSNVIAAH